MQKCKSIVISPVTCQASQIKGLTNPIETNQMQQNMASCEVLHIKKISQAPGILEMVMFEL